MKWGGEITLYNLFIAPITDGHQFIYNLGGWFIAPLFMVEIYNILIRKALKLINKNLSEWVFFAVSLAVGIIGNQLACMGYTQGWWLVFNRMVYFIPFYEIGILYKSKLEKYDRKIPSFWYFIILFVIRLLIEYHFDRMPSYSPSFIYGYAEGPVMPIIIGFTGIAFWMRIANILEPVIGKSKWVNIIADNTYSIMINQFLGFMLVKTIYALLSRYYSGFSDFDRLSYKTNIWYYYLPKGIEHTLIIYVAAGLIVPIVIQKVIDKIKALLRIRRVSRRAAE